jgi:hypothetical protein
MDEIVPGIHHWTAMHPDIHMRVSSYYVEPAGIVIDPLEPEEGMGFFDKLDTAPQQVVLTSGLHWRHSDRFRDRYDAVVRVVAEGIERWHTSGITDREAEPFGFNDEVAPGVIAHEVAGIAPDDTALIIEHGEGAIAFADALIAPDGVLAFVPDSLMDDPRDTKHALRDRLRGLLTKRFDSLLFAHGRPIRNGGHDRLKDFVNAPGGEPDWGQTE